MTKQMMMNKLAVVLPASRVIPLQIWDDGEETSGSISTSIHTGQTLQQHDRRGWSLGTQEMNSQYFKKQS